jgi:hypothetical protein
VSLLPPRMGPGRTGVPQGKASKRTADADPIYLNGWRAKPPRAPMRPLSPWGACLAVTLTLEVLLIDGFRRTGEHLPPSPSLLFSLDTDRRRDDRGRVR